MSNKIFYDFEFLEGTQTKRFMGIPYGQTKPTIDIISVGMVSSDNREYYAVSKDFNLWEAWNRYQLEDDNSVGVRIGCLPPQKKVYWIRENVLKPIWADFEYSEYLSERSVLEERISKEAWVKNWASNFTKKRLKLLLNKYGKTKEQIAEEVVSFVYPNLYLMEKDRFKYERKINDITGNEPPELYGYYSSFDHVALSWLFGKMIDLPKGFPMYTKDLKQMWDERISKMHKECPVLSWEDWSAEISAHEGYPAKPTTHHALLDAKWNMELHRFIQAL